MAKKRSNPFTGDGQTPAPAWRNKSGDKALGRENVKVTAHERKRPVRHYAGPRDVAQNIDYAGDRVPDNTFVGEGDSPEGPQAQNGLVGGGNEKVNHLRGAISLLNRSRA